MRDEAKRRRKEQYPALLWLLFTESLLCVKQNVLLITCIVSWILYKNSEVATTVNPILQMRKLRLDAV